MLVTQDDFNLIPYNLVGLPEDDTFQSFIDEQEENYLRPLLGNLFYDAMVEGVESLPDAYDANETYAVDDEVYSDVKIYKSLVADNMGQVVTDGAYWEEVVDVARTRWLVLIAGVNYIYADNTYKWFGMKKMVKPLIYSLWSKHNVSGDTAQGKTTAAVENSNRADNFQSICDAWNKFVDYACGKYICVEGLRYLPAALVTNYDSLYGYLYSTTDFDDLDLSPYDTLVDYVQYSFTNPGRMNAFGI